MFRRARWVVIALLFGCGDSADAGPLGELCRSDADCNELTCSLDLDADPADLEPAALACQSAAGGGLPGEACDEASDCDHGLCLLAGACAVACEAAGDCSARERCQAVFARTSTETLQTLSACVSVIDLPDDADVSIELMEGALGGELDTLELPAAQTGGGDTVYVLEHSVDSWPDGVVCRPPLCVRKIESDGEPALLFDAELDYSIAPAPRAAAVQGDHQDPAIFRIDAALADELDGSALRVTLESEVAGDLRVTRVHRERRGQRLDLNVFYLGALDWEPTGSRGPELLESALEVVDEIFSPADIFIGEVRQIALPGALPMRGVAFPEGDVGAGFAVLMERFGVYVELPHLFMLSAGAGNSAINLFFVEDIRPRSGGAGEPLAESGGIPGPPGMHGTGGSGIAISTEMMSGSAANLGRTLAHELSHYLGLFHTSESTGSVYEALDDTPECRRGDDCAQHESNLMWWAPSTQTELSDQQIDVLKSSAVLQ